MVPGSGALGWESPRDNLFWQAWIPVGIHGLFPRGQPNGYAPGDGLFARGAFAPAEATLRRALDDGTRFPAGCPLTVGVTVTRIRPADIIIKSADAQSGSDGIHIPTQRFVSTFGLQTGAAGLRFRQLSEHDHEIGEYLTLPSKDGGGLVTDDQVLDIIRASSAFPVAFGPQVIRHCPEDGPGHGRTGCGAPIADQFIDGGVFDNVPLGLAVSLTGQILAPGAAEQVHYVYVNPDHARSYSKAPHSAAGAPGDQAGRPLDHLRFHLHLRRRLGAVRAADGRALPLQADRRTTSERPEAAARDAAPPVELTVSSADGVVPGPLRRVLRGAVPRARLLRRHL